MTVKMIAFDIDDTLLNSDGKILNSTKQAVTKALAKGIKVVLCTGRPLAGVTSYLDELGIIGDEQFIVTNNGAIIESISGHIVSKKVLDNAAYRRLVKYGHDNGLKYYALDDDSNVYTDDRDINRIAVIQAFENRAGIYFRSPNELPDDFEVTKVAYVGEKSDLDPYEDAVKSEFKDICYVVRAGEWFLELMHKNVSKASGLQDLSTKLNIYPDEIMAFGDEQNDIPMFQFVGNAVCMENGSDKAKGYASYVTDSNDNDGIAKAMDKFVFGK
ncbi:Cof-type HAD-IIB family hydrolase [Companilactobacillus allii]|uniref:Hydrolase n=1 Tax=Companilactobacillus allii TaxID=1847728 RepID=A0A1P8Q5W5_9LACO|nr:Cof-type HAD-IIB family hydrolase [Companilactobacillus allii]APX73232.1 hydrolase [Companilactobacillus allii]USQ68044.1 Cof-type HAD-IIB family hydrolase [Companilactobacillus allii]